MELLNQEYIKPGREKKILEKNICYVGDVPFRPTFRFRHQFNSGVDHGCIIRQTKNTLFNTGTAAILLITFEEKIRAG